MSRGVTNSTSGGVGNKLTKFTDLILLIDFLEIFQISSSVWDLLTFYCIFPCKCTVNVPGVTNFTCGGDGNRLTEFLDFLFISKSFGIFQLSLSILEILAKQTFEVQKSE